jgi:hypothetical protein
LTVGAVNRPSEEIVPALTLQVTAVFAVFVKLAVNCNSAPDETTASAGVILGFEFEVDEPSGSCVAEDSEEQLALASPNRRRPNRIVF